ncbi:MAG TPA: PVC-type heme-binding CxxCH protein, partial [Planctomycetaceae bacterium]|nr:PVC-type heme-binding CxxCH protein [Planctomycetaceae bacterium]
TVIGHLWHVVPGAHFRRMYGTDFNPYLFGLIEQTADHFHWDTKETWSDIRKIGVTDTTSAAGGGHAHSGFMIYLGDNFPEQYRGGAFTVNLHGHRLNHDRLERHNAGYVGKHAADFLFAGDPWFRAVELIYGPDGGVYLADWSDIGECHESDGVHRTSGRIYKVTFGTPKKPERLDLSTWTDAELVQAQRHRNDWWSRQARRLLQERATDGRDMTAARAALSDLFDDSTEVTHRLRAMWCLWSMDALDDGWLVKQLADKEEHVRTWAVRLLADEDFLAKEPQEVRNAVEGLTRLAAKEVFGSDEEIRSLKATRPKDSSGLVMLFLASALQRLPLSDRWDIAEMLSWRGDFAKDNALPLMIWYGIEPAVTRDTKRAVHLAERSRIPLLRQFIARRLTLEIERQPEAVESLLLAVQQFHHNDGRYDILLGMSEALRGWTKVTPPKNWEAVRKTIHAESRWKNLHDLVRELSVVFGDGRAIDELKALVSDGGADVSARQQALRTLVTAKSDDLVPLLHKLLDDRDLLVEAMRGLASFDNAETPKKVIERFGRLSPEGRTIAVSTLVARPSYAKELLNAVAAEQISRREISAFHARQILSFGDDALTKELAQVWGEVRSSSAEKQQLAAKWKASLTPERLATAKLSDGRALFNKTCANCHVLYGSGKSAGPDLTGGNRRNLDYLLENILDPSATVAADFRMSVFAMTDGRVINGVIVEQTEKT